MNSNWHNVTRNEPCPICGKPDWCTVSNDGEVCVCRRVESPHPSAGGSGWIHALKAPSGPFRRTPAADRTKCRAREENAPRPDFAALHASFDGDGLLLDHLIGSELGLVGDGLAAVLDVRLNYASDVLSFPMRDAAGEITGLRYRHLLDGRKWSARGSRDGLFMPVGAKACERPDTLVICEGPSDTLAALSLGLDAVGRSSCMSGVPLIGEYLRRKRPRHVLIMADGDRPGRAGARRLSDALGLAARILLPPPGIKDLRDWVLAGLTEEAIHRLLPRLL